MNRYTDHRCVNPDCDGITSVKHYPASRVDPGYPDVDSCIWCGAELDWDGGEAFDPFDPAERADEEFERAGNR